MSVLDLFAGTGWGVALQAMGRTEYAVENDPNVIETRLRNGMHLFTEDAWNAERILDLDGKFDTLLASPPCQTFSTTGNRKGYRQLQFLKDIIDSRNYDDIDFLRRVSFEEHDDRIGLVLLPLHYVHHFRPEFAVFEQVTTVLPLWEKMASHLRLMGHATWTGILRAEEYGLPQSRRRAFLIASRFKAAEPPPTSHSKFHQKDPDRLDAGKPKWTSAHQAFGTDEDFLIRYPYSATATRKTDDEKWSWDRESRGSMVRTGHFPALSMTSKVPHILPDTPENRIPRRHVPENGRTMTVEEAKILMTYPREFQFPYGKTDAFKQLGNAVPPTLATHILTHLWRKQ